VNIGVGIRGLLFWRKADGTASGLCPEACLHVSGVTPQLCATREFVLL
jgi:hypothetical protein